jgi:hypothetical protein
MHSRELRLRKDKPSRQLYYKQTAFFFINNPYYVFARRALALTDDTCAVRQCGEQSSVTRRLLTCTATHLPWRAVPGNTVRRKCRLHLPWRAVPGRTRAHRSDMIHTICSYRFFLKNSYVRDQANSADAESYSGRSSSTNQ